MRNDFPELNIRSTDFGQISYRRLGEGRRKILFFHGFPGSSLQIEVFAKWISDFGLEVLCFDRPGYNQTQIRSASPLSGTIQAARSLTELFQWQEFEIVAVSGGTPSALVLAHEVQQRIRAVHIISGLGPLHDLEMRKSLSRISYAALKILPWLPGWSIKAVFGSGLKKERKAKNQLLRSLLPFSSEDLELMEEPRAEALLRGSLCEALLQDALGPQWDARLFTSKWVSEKYESTCEVHFWHGENDCVISHHASEKLAHRFSNSEFHSLKDEGHFSVIARRLGDILRQYEQA